VALSCRNIGRVPRYRHKPWRSTRLVTETAQTRARQMINRWRHLIVHVLLAAPSPRKRVGKMAWYKYRQFLSPKDLDEFDKAYDAGMAVDWSGIYMCVGCGREIVHTALLPLPPEDHHPHQIAQGTIRWRLIVTNTNT
jgi:hypothetical protein